MYNITDFKKEKGHRNSFFPFQFSFFFPIYNSTSSLHMLYIYISYDLVQILRIDTSLPS